MTNNIEKTILSFPDPQKGTQNLEPLCCDKIKECDVIAVVDEWGMQEYLKEVFDFQKPKNTNEKYFWETTEYCRFRFVDFFKSITQDLFPDQQESHKLSAIRFYSALPYNREKNKDYTMLLEDQRHTYDQEPQKPFYKNLKRPSPEKRKDLNTYLYHVRDAFLWSLQEKGIEIGEGRLKAKDNGGYRQKGVDVLISLEMIFESLGIDLKELFSSPNPLPPEKILHLLQSAQEIQAETRKKVFLLCTTDNDLAYTTRYTKQLGAKTIWMPLKKEFNPQKSIKELSLLSDAIAHCNPEFVKQFKGDKKKPDSTLLSEQ